MYTLQKPKEFKTVDAPKKKSPFIKGRGPSTVYERALRQVTKQIGNIVKGHLMDDPLNPDKVRSLQQALRTYGNLIGPWALHLVNNVLRQVDAQDKYAWRQHTLKMSQELRRELQEAPISNVFKNLIQQNVELIKSIPEKAAERVGILVQENMMHSERASEIAKRIMNTEHVTLSRAMLIARTETSKASLALTQARAQHVGSDGYIWRTSGDMIVRDSHKRMNGVFVEWDDPPTLDNMTGHAGGFPNCRCWTDVVIPEDLE